MDFDAKHHSGEAVEQDVRQCLAWIAECGGRAISDRSTSGGRHVIVPLPVGTILTKTEIEPIMRLLAERLPTLDTSPMLNDRTGALTPPGSRCKEGGFRQLDGPLATAVNTMQVRSDHGFVGRLVELLGGARVAAHPIDPDAHTTHTARAARTSASRAPEVSTGDHVRVWEGSGDMARLRAEYQRRTPMPAVVTAFAMHGLAPADRRWRARDGRLDRSAARQSVLAAAVRQGMSLVDVLAQLPTAGGAWAGLARAYARYGSGADAAMRRDWDKACRWAAVNAAEFLPVTHKSSRHTGGGGGDRVRARIQTRWLANAIAWVDAQWPGSPRRSSVLAVLQALAHASVVGGETVRGVPVVELGGRSVSIMAGCLPESTVWQTLRDIRDIPGAPVLRVRRGAGVLADRYALVTASIGGRRARPSRTQANFARVEPVHMAWSVLGIHHRRLYEAIVYQGLVNPDDALAAARMGRSTGHAALCSLATAGLITRSRGAVAPGPTSLDDVAHAHGLEHALTERIARHRRERRIWTAWLAARFAAYAAPAGCRHVPAEPWTVFETEDYLVSVLAAGPPGLSRSRRDAAATDSWNGRSESSAGPPQRPSAGREHGPRSSRCPLS
ncbi:hypothetical protein [Nocardia sp. GP40]|uniref:hypothetical protein n=1 Tax=Nocardia sp. GP40 TaxID=3156268 RepID=UPI003D23AB3C